MMPFSDTSIPHCLVGVGAQFSALVHVKLIAGAVEALRQYRLELVLVAKEARLQLHFQQLGVCVGSRELAPVPAALFKSLMMIVLCSQSE